jgi:hypothetical protein
MSLSFCDKIDDNPVFLSHLLTSMRRGDTSNLPKRGPRRRRALPAPTEPDKVRLRLHPELLWQL